MLLYNNTGFVITGFVVTVVVVVKVSFGPNTTLPLHTSTSNLALGAPLYPPLKLVLRKDVDVFKESV